MQVADATFFGPTGFLSAVAVAFYGVAFVIFCSKLTVFKSIFDGYLRD
jgi:hypothetical protein